MTRAIAAGAKPLAASEAARAVRLVRAALSKYPTDVLRLNLERIYVVGGLRYEGIEASGTNSATRLYIVIEAGNPLYTDGFIEESLHHEFAHLLRRNYPDLFDEPAWRSVNPLSFHYGAASGVEAVKTGHASLDASDDWNRLGFVNEYAAGDIDEDFAMTCGCLFVGDGDFLAARRPLRPAPEQDRGRDRLLPEAGRPFQRKLLPQPARGHRVRAAGSASDRCDGYQSHDRSGSEYRHVICRPHRESNARRTGCRAARLGPNRPSARSRVAFGPDTRRAVIDRIAPTRRPVGPHRVMRQLWRDLLFIHWPIEPAVLQALLPGGLTVDTFEGRAYIGLVPFTMRGVRPIWAPPVPWLLELRREQRPYLRPPRRRGPRRLVLQSGRDQPGRGRHRAPDLATPVLQRPHHDTPRRRAHGLPHPAARRVGRHAGRSLTRALPADRHTRARCARDPRIVPGRALPALCPGARSPLARASPPSSVPAPGCPHRRP